MAVTPPTDTARVQTLVAAPPDACFDVATDIARYAEWAQSIAEVEVLEHDELGRVATARFTAAAIGRAATYVLRYDYADAPGRLAWSQISGDLTASVDGAYTFEPSVDDPGSTLVTYELAIGLIVPLPGFVKRRAEDKIVEAALNRFRRRVEENSRDFA